MGKTKEINVDGLAIGFDLNINKIAGELAIITRPAWSSVWFLNELAKEDKEGVEHGLVVGARGEMLSVQ